MNTFLPYKSFRKTAKCLDFRRLGKQRVEAKQILNNLTVKRDRWYSHPIVGMWKGYEEALKLYFNMISKEWIKRGYIHNMGFYRVNRVIFPSWLGNKEFHDSHKSNLLRKDYEFYSKYGWNVPADLPYVWVI